MFKIRPCAPGDLDDLYHIALMTCASGKDASALSVELKKHGVIVSARHGQLRVSTHFYNNEDDVARLAGTIQSLL